MNKVYIMCGMPGAGKSTYVANNLPGVEVISRDIIRCKLGMTSSVDEKFVGTREQENQVTVYENNLIKDAIANNQDFVLDNMNGGPWLNKTIETIKSYNPNVEFIAINLRTPLDVCIERRKGQIDEETMVRISTRFHYIENRPEFSEIINIEY